MNGLKYILLGLASIFGVGGQGVPGKGSAIDYKHYKSDKEAMRQDWLNISQDMHRAFNKVKKTYGEK